MAPCQRKSSILIRREKLAWVQRLASWLTHVTLNSFPKIRDQQDFLLVRSLDSYQKNLCCDLGIDKIQNKTYLYKFLFASAF